MRGILCGRLDCLRLPRIALWSRGVLQFNLIVGGGCAYAFTLPAMERRTDYVDKPT